MNLFHFYESYKNHSSQEARPACTDLNLLVMMKSPQVGHMTNVYDFISTATNLITTKLGKIVDQHTLILPCRYDDITTTRSRNQSAWFISISIKPETTKLHWKPHQYDLTLLIGNDEVITIRSCD